MTPRDTVGVACSLCANVWCYRVGALRIAFTNAPTLVGKRPSMISTLKFKAKKMAHKYPQYSTIAAFFP